MRRLLASLPGPAPVRALIVVVAVVIVLIALFFLFEWAGGILDDGGTIG